LLRAHGIPLCGWDWESWRPTLSRRRSRRPPSVSVWRSMNPIPDELYSRFTRRARPLSARYTTVTHVRRRTQRDLRLRVCPSRGGCPVSAQAVEPEAETRRRHAAQLPAGVAALVTLGRAPRGRSSGTTLEYPEADALTWGKGSSDWTRTSNPSVNSRMLCRLSYGGPPCPVRRGAGREHGTARGPPPIPTGWGRMGPPTTSEENT
jgi:hypothetical protein